MNVVPIAVGSFNPVKIAAARVGFETIFPDATFEPVGRAVESGVSDQPMSSKETLRGARGRVTALRRTPDEAEYYVGIEGGIEIIEGRFYASAWIVVENHQGQEGLAKSGLFPIPPAVQQLVESGVELGVANDRVFRLLNSKQDGGAVGSLTAGVISRQALYEHAMCLALIPFRQPALF